MINAVQIRRTYYTVCNIRNSCPAGAGGALCGVGEHSISEVLDAAASSALDAALSSGRVRAVHYDMAHRLTRDAEYTILVCQAWLELLEL